MPAGEIRSRIERCGSWLVLRQYLDDGQCCVHAANWCWRTNICIGCATARALRLWRKLSVFRWENPYLLTLTWTNEPTIAGMRASLLNAYKAWEHLTRNKKTRARIFGSVSFMYLVTEITYKGKGWHPHFHVILHGSKGIKPVDLQLLRAEWLARTGGREIHIEPMRDSRGITEVCKYLVSAPIEVTERVDWLALDKALRRIRLTRQRGRKPAVDPEKVLESVAAGRQFEDFFVRWVGARYHSRLPLGGGRLHRLDG